MPLFRRCSAGYPIYWYSGGRFIPPEIQSARTQPEKAHVVVTVFDGEVSVKEETNDYHKAESAYLAQCRIHHGPGQPITGSYELGRDKIVGGVVVNQKEGEGVKCVTLLAKFWSWMTRQKCSTIYS